jgi:hypothetical protein
MASLKVHRSAEAKVKLGQRCEVARRPEQVVGFWLLLDLADSASDHLADIRLGGFSPLASILD